MAIQDSGSNYSFYDKTIHDHVPRSGFDLSHLNTFTANFGAIIPVHMIWTMPNADYTISLQHLVKLLPTVVSPMSRMRVFFHAYGMEYGQMWKHWGAFISKGHNGKYVDAVIPTIDINQLLDGTRLADDDVAVLPETLADYLHLPQGLTSKRVRDLGICALPFMMYQAIYKHYYLNKNLDHMNNLNWFPLDEDDWRLSDGPISLFRTTDDVSMLGVRLSNLRYRNYVDDYFTSALPFPMRGDIPTMQFNFSGVSQNIPVYVDMNNGQKLVPAYILRGQLGGSSSGMVLNTFANSARISPYAATGDSSDSQGNVVAFGENVDSGVVANTSNGSARFVVRAEDITGQSFSGGFTLEQFRGLAIATGIMEKMARTDGTFSQFMSQFFHSHPATANSLKPVYIGGTYDPIITSEVLQTSPTVVDSSGQATTTPQGHGAGRGISASSGFLGKYHSNDYGLIMVVMTIMPDTYYHQGLERQWTYRTQEEFPLPERCKLGPQEILNKELYVDNDMPIDDSAKGTDGLFAWQDRYDEWRYCQNRIAGRIADFTEDGYSDFNSYTQVRHFTSLPRLNDSFVTTQGNVNTDFMAVDADRLSPFICQTALRCRAVLPLPYKAVPADMVQ